jgi:hypothetical protein
MVPTWQIILVCLCIPLGLTVAYLAWVLSVNHGMHRLYQGNDPEAGRRPGGQQFWMDFFSGRAVLGGRQREPGGRPQRRRKPESESTRAILHFGVSNPSTRSLVTGYEGGEEYEMHPPVDVPLPPTFVHPHLASSVGTVVCLL